MPRKLKLTHFELSELKTGREITLTAIITPAPSMLSAPYQWQGEEGKSANWHSGHGLMSCSHKCPFGKDGDEHTASGIPVQVKEIWCDLTDTSKPVHWKDNPWRFYAIIKKK